MNRFQYFICLLKRLVHVGFNHDQHDLATNVPLSFVCAFVKSQKVLLNNLFQSKYVFHAAYSNLLLLSFAFAFSINTKATRIHIHDWYGMEWCQISILFNFQGVQRPHERTLLNSFLKHFTHLSIFDYAFEFLMRNEVWSLFMLVFSVIENAQSTSIGSQVLFTRLRARWKPNYVK